MKNILRSSLILSLLATTATPALAIPTLYPRPTNRLSEVINDTSSPVISDSAEPDQLWVLPAQRGEVEMTGVTAGTNIGFCREMTFLQSASLRMSQRIEATSAELDTVYRPRLDELQATQAELAQAAARFRENPIAEHMDELVRSIRIAEDRIDDLRELQNDCDSPQCEDIAAEIEELQAERRADRAELAALRREHAEVWRQREQLEAEVRAVQDAIDDVESQVLGRIATIIRTKNLLIDMYAQYGRFEGGFGNLTYSSDWAENVASVRRANAGFSVLPIETSEVRMNLALVPGLGTDRYLEQLPMVLGYSVNGQEYDPADPFQSLPALPDIISANVRLSVIGACPIVFPNDWQVERKLDGMPLFGLTVSYTYPSAFRTRAEGTYNLHKIYEYYKKEEKKGGFFRSSTKVTEWKTETGDAVVDVEILDESGMSPEEVEALREEVAKQLMQHVLIAMGVPAPNTSSPNPISPPPNGAIVFADGLRATCAWSIWCLGGSWVLRGLNAVFGGSAAEASYKATYDHDVRLAYDVDRALPRAAVLSYGPAED